MFYNKLQGQKQISFVILLSYFFFSPFFFYDKKMTMFICKSNNLPIHYAHARFLLYKGNFATLFRIILNYFCKLLIFN